MFEGQNQRRENLTKCLDLASRGIVCLEEGAGSLERRFGLGGDVGSLSRHFPLEAARGLLKPAFLRLDRQAHPQAVHS